MDLRLETAISAIKKSGEYLRSEFLKKHSISIKSDKTVLLGEDKKSEEILISYISNSFPNDTFLTEERVTKYNADSVWVIDPLCGSYSYLRGVETWSISAAYITSEGSQIGLVYQPYLQNIFYSQKGKGAFMNNQKINPTKIIDVSEAFISIEHGAFNNPDIQLSQLIKKIKRLRVGHGSGGELSYVAAGFLDAVIKTDQSIMHFAGGRAIVEESGGVFLDFFGKNAPLFLDRQKHINYLACNNNLLAKNILDLIVK